MTENILILEQAAHSFITQAKDRPVPQAVIDALLAEEKNAKKAKTSLSLEQIKGTWRLFFIAGTKKAQSRAGVILGAGRYITNWVKIYISYSSTENSEIGTIDNSVQFGSLTLSLSGPMKILPNRKIVVFDFTRMTLQVFGQKIYSGYIRGGQKSEENFEQAKINKQAFFNYFTVSDKIIAARGKGGGLAIWLKEAE